MRGKKTRYTGIGSGESESTAEVVDVNDVLFVVGTTALG